VGIHGRVIGRRPGRVADTLPVHGSLGAVAQGGHGPLTMPHTHVNVCAVGGGFLPPPKYILFLRLINFVHRASVNKFYT